MPELWHFRHSEQRYSVSDCTLLPLSHPFCWHRSHMEAQRLHFLHTAYIHKSVLQAVKGLCITVSDFYIVFSLSDSGPKIHVKRRGCCGTKQMDLLFFKLVQSHPSAWRERTASCGWSGVSGNREWEILRRKTISGFSCSSICTQANNAQEVKEIPLHWVLASYR